ncbi:MAG: ATP-binding cassette domain-containing protein [Bacteroidetes bacterium]|jgi:ABC-type multidrug transport system ATPase subunit|nr:ATP-binding cassette domain-containing protein [Bacteroidota bacterium]
MSEKILKALMQLFAIIATPNSNNTDRRSVVESFLRRLLNEDLVEEYLGVFDHYFHIHQIQEQEIKKISKKSVRVLKICVQINEELTHQQKLIVLVNLFEFVKSDSTKISEQEYEFISTVANTFNIEDDEHNRIRDFTILPSENLPDSSQILSINSNENFTHENVRHIYNENLNGEIRVLHISSANLYLARYFGNKEMYLNGQLLVPDKVYVLNTGSSIRNPQIKPVYYSDVVSTFIADSRGLKIIFEASNISYQFSNGAYGLHNFSFSEDSGRLIGIMGASGAGKSTLLNILNGSEPPTTGSVTINGLNIHTNKADIEGIIGHVSQDDLLIEELTVFQNLYFNAKLCFDNYTHEQINEAVNNTLINLGLHEIKDIQVGSPLNKKISGGQRKRLNIALELIREPAVLFLDEPTSGLSSRDSENILDLLKELSLKGKLVFVVIHQPSSDIFKMFDKLIILDTGGYPIYRGDPIESIVYFKSRVHHANWNESECHACGNVNPEQIFNIVESKMIDEYGKFTRTRKITPREWNKFYKEFNTQPETAKDDKKLEIPHVSFKIPNVIKQWWVFVQRDVLSKFSNRQYLVINFLEAPLLAFILSFITKYRDVSAANELGYTFMGNSNIPVYIFMAVIVAIFIGLTVSAEEIIKDRKILKREAFLNLSWGSYLMSKVAILFALSAIQAFTFVILGNSILEIKGMYFQYWLILFSAWCASNIMGLVISDSFKTVVTIYILIPFLVIPQIILSGVIVKYEKINPSIASPNKIPVYGELILARWGYEALAVEQFKENEFERIFYPLDKAMSMTEYKKNYWVRDLQNKINYVQRNQGEIEDKIKIISYLEVLRNEINKEKEINKGIPAPDVSGLYINKLNEGLLEDVKNYVEELRKYYVQAYNNVNHERDELIRSMQETPEEKELFMQLKRDYHNEKLTEFVENTNEPSRIIEYQGELYQKVDPIYNDPEHPLIKAHFYAPRKQFINSYFSTFWVNVIVIWLFAIILYWILHKRWLKKLLNYFEYISSKYRRS